MSMRSPKTFAPALTLGCAIGAAITFAVMRADRTIAVNLSHEQVGARASEILNDSDPLERIGQFHALLSKLDASAAPAIVEVFETAPLDGGDPEFQVFGIWWARSDPEAALAWTTTDTRASFGTVIAAIVRSWARSDPQLAFSSARALTFPGQRELATDAAIAGWDESGQPGLLEVVIGLTGSDQQRVADSIARRRVQTLGPAAAFEWVEALGASQDFKDMMAVRVASAAAAVEGGGPIAAAWATPRVRSDERLSNYPRRIATRWVTRDPDAAMAWLATLPAGADRSDGVAEAFRAWAIRDHEAAFAWAEKLELQPWNEAAMAVYARAIASERPKDAIELAQRFSVTGLRESTMIVIGQVWLREDRAAAEAWLAQPGIPERVRKVSRMGAKARAADGAAPVPDANASPDENKAAL